MGHLLLSHLLLICLLLRFRTSSSKLWRGTSKMWPSTSRSKLGWNVRRRSSKMRSCRWKVVVGQVNLAVGRRRRTPRWRNLAGWKHRMSSWGRWRTLIKVVVFLVRRWRAGLIEHGVHCEWNSATDSQQVFLHTWQLGLGAFLQVLRTFADFHSCVSRALMLCHLNCGCLSFFRWFLLLLLPFDGVPSLQSDCLHFNFVSHKFWFNFDQKLFD